jgi:hypothetical protein
MEVVAALTSGPHGVNFSIEGLKAELLGIVKDYIGPHSIDKEDKMRLCRDRLSRFIAPDYNVVQYDKYLNVSHLRRYMSATYSCQRPFVKRRQERSLCVK